MGVISREQKERITTGMLRGASAVIFALALGISGAVFASPDIREYPVPNGSHPHDVAPALDGGVWYTAQNSGELGWLDPKTGKTRHIALGRGSSPHGVIVGPDGAPPWITDSGLNAIVRMDPKTDKVSVFPLPKDTPYTNLNTATFDKSGVLWFTGQRGYYGSLNPKTGETKVFNAPRGRGPYGICTAPDGSVYYASLAGSHIARIDTKTGAATVIEPPTKDQGARRVWADSKKPYLGELLEYRTGRYVRPEDEHMARMETAGRRSPSLCRVRGRQGHRLAFRLWRQRHRAFRSQEREIQGLSTHQPRRRCAPDSRPAGRSLVAGIGGEQAGGDPRVT